MSFNDRTFFDQEHYEDLWDEMMEYTEFRSVEKMEQEDIPTFFKQVDDDARSKKRARLPFYHNPKLRRSMTYSWHRRREYTKEGGRDLKRDRATTAKDTVTTTADYTDASKQDLRGLDTKGAGKRTYSIAGSIKRKGITTRVYATRTESKGKTYFRDAKGRFVRVKK